MDKKVAIILGIATLTVFIAGIFLVSRNSGQTSYKIYDETIVKGESRLKRGADAGKVTIVEFADFQCPACAAAHPYIKKLLEKYPNELTFIYRHFPLTQHKNAFIASEVSEAAAKQGKFWEMYDILYTRQKDWQDLDKPLDKFIDYAHEVGLNEEDFKKDIEGRVYKSLIEKDLTNAYQVDVDATPTFYVNNQKAIVPFDRLEEEVISRLN